MSEDVKDPTQYEKQVVNYINNYIKKNKAPINIVLDGVTYKMIAGAIQVDSAIKRAGGVTSDPKADIILYVDKKKLFDSKNNIYISHKKAGGPEVFQQYGGITEKAGNEIYNHKEVQDFLMNTAKFVDDKKGLIKPLMRKVKDKTLICKSIFGPDYTKNGKNFGLQHVNLIGQGMPTLTPTKKLNTYKLSFNHMSLSGDLSKFTQRYTPVFGATFRRKRGFKYKNVQYTGVRVGIYPKALVDTRTNLTEI